MRKNEKRVENYNKILIRMFCDDFDALSKERGICAKITEISSDMSSLICAITDISGICVRIVSIEGCFRKDILSGFQCASLEKAKYG